MRRKFLYFAPLAIVGVLAFIALGGFIVEQLWNWLAPALFGWPAITFWQAVGLLALCRILFGGLGRHGHGPSLRRGRKGHWMSMTPDERERFRQRMRERCEIEPEPPPQAGNA